jgi:hypothetical protein
VLGAAVCLALLASGCFNAGIPIRTADLPAPGNVGGHLQVTALTYAPGETVGSDGSRGEPFFGQRVGLLDPLVVIILPASLAIFNGALGVEVGLADGLSIDLSLGLQQLGGDLRLALMDQDDHAPVSLALSAGAAYRPFIDATIPWLSAGLDLSRRWTSVVAIANFYATYGPESHVAYLWGEQSDQSTDDDEGAAPYFALTRDEVRLNLSLGLGPTTRSQDLESDFLFALVGYWTAMTESPDLMECYRCDALEPFTYEADLGVSLVFSVGFHGPY